MKRRTVLNSMDAKRLLRHMAEDPPNPLAKASLERGRKLFTEMSEGFVQLGKDRSSESSHGSLKQEFTTGFRSGWRAFWSPFVWLYRVCKDKTTHKS